MMVKNNERFDLQVAGIAIGHETKLMWCRFLHGQEWQNGKVVGQAIKVNWEVAFEVAKTFNQNGGYAGYTDWRLPTIDELVTLVDRVKGNFGNYIDSDVFPKNNGGWAWSSSPRAYDSSNAWVVNFSNGNDGYDSRSSSYVVRLVRNASLTNF